MKFKTTAINRTKEILANDHYVGVPYNCAALAANEDGIVPAGTIVPANDASAIGVLLYDVAKDDNPNGTIVVHGWIKKAKLPAAPAEGVKLPMIAFVD